MLTKLTADLRCASIVLICIALLVGRVAAQPQSDPPIGTSRQPLRTNAPVISAEEQEELGLVAVQRAGSGRHCSGVLLTNTWVVTAAHCVDTQVDRANPATLEVVANWREAAGAPRAGSQTRAAAAIYTAWGSRVRGQPNVPPSTTYDVALVRLADPMRVSGWPAGFVRPIESAGVADLVGVSLRVFGRGLNAWAGANAGVPMPSTGDGRYRGDTFTVTRYSLNGAAVSSGGFANLLEYPSSAAQSVMGGDSGGPSFRTGDDGISRLVGVHALCSSPPSCLSDQQCPAAGGSTVSCFPAQRCPDPVDRNQWRWVTGLNWCADASVISVRNAINQLMEQTWDPTQPVQTLQVSHSEGTIEKDMLLGPLDGLRWAYVQRAVQKMCVNRGFVAGLATGQHVAGKSYNIVCFSAAAGRRFDIGPGAGGMWAFTDPDQVDWAWAGRSAQEICRTSDPTSPGGFHTGFALPGSGIVQTQLGVFCLNASGGSWSDTSATTLGAAADLGTVTWAAAFRAASNRCRLLGFSSGGFLTGHEGPGVRGTVCLGQAEVTLQRQRPSLPSP